MSLETKYFYDLIMSR